MDEVVALTEAMLSHAREGAWEEVVRLQGVRRAALVRVFAAPVPREDAPALAEAIRRVLACDRELTALCLAARDEAAAALREVRRGRRAATAYEAVVG